MLFTDVVMTQGDDRPPACRLRARACAPRLPVLFTTGYSRNAIVHQGRLDANVNLLSKPYTQGELVQKVRAVLDEASREQLRDGNAA